jgi:hypothetical protein
MPHYHEFADRAPGWASPNAADVLSNLGFALVGVLGLALLWQNRASPALRRGARVMRCSSLALVLTTAGSGWYHLAPDNARCFGTGCRSPWPAPGCLRRCGARPSAAIGRIATAVLAASALGSVLWWRYTDALGAAICAPICCSSFCPSLLVPLLQWQHGPAAERRAFALALGLYVLAKCLELADHATFAALHVRQRAHAQAPPCYIGGRG